MFLESGVKEMNNTITENTTLRELAHREGWEEIMPYLVYSPGGMGGGLNMNMSFWDIEKSQPTWKTEDMLFGLKRIDSILEKKQKFSYPVYEEQDVEEAPEKKDVKVFYFPADSREFVILAAGGAYGAVCSLAEAFPVAAKLNRLGIKVFCLNYRVGGPMLFPKPMEDLAAASRFITKHAEEFGVDAEKYAVGGFSAGGHLAASWGLKSIGYQAYGCPAPECILLDYPLIDVWDTLQKMPEPIKMMMLEGYFGKDNPEEICMKYEIVRNMDEAYPPAYLVQAEDDSTVPISNTRHMAEKLTELGIMHQYEHVPTGQHGFGLGTGTDAEGWAERAVTFWKNLKK